MRVRRCTTVIPAAIPPAATMPPTGPGNPSSMAVATPGSIPWAIASPRNAMPRTTTQVPVTAHNTATSTPPMRARSMNSDANGSHKNDTRH